MDKKYQEFKIGMEISPPLMPLDKEKVWRFALPQQCLPWAHLSWPS